MLQITLAENLEFRLTIFQFHWDKFLSPNHKSCWSHISHLWPSSRPSWGRLQNPDTFSDSQI